MDSKRISLLVIFVLFSVLVGCIAGWLHWLGKREVPTAICAGGIAFGGTVSLLMAMYFFVA